MVYNLLTHGREYSLSLDIKDISQIANSLKSYASFDDYRCLFISKEWILSYCQNYNPDEFLFVKSLQDDSYFVMEVCNDQIHFLGDPFNDYNYLEIPENDLCEILSFIQNLTKKRICINCFATPLPVVYKKSREDIGLKRVLHDNSSMISHKLTRMYNREKAQISFYRITPSDVLFSQLLYKLLSERIEVLKSKDIEGNDSSVNELFSKFIISLCFNCSIKDNVFIDYGMHRGQIVSIGLNFVNGSNVLYYLRWCNHVSNRYSFGLLHDIISLDTNRNVGYSITDFARGDEAYKYRLGLTEYYLYNYEL